MQNIYIYIGIEEKWDICKNQWMNWTKKYKWEMVVNKEQEKSQSGQNRMFSSETNGRFKLKRGVVRLNQSETEPTTRIILSNTVGSRLEGNRDR